MKPLFAPGKGASSAEPAATPPSPIEEKTPTPSPQPGAGKPIELLLQEALERGALTMVNKLGEPGATPTVRELKEGLDLGERLLKQRKQILEANDQEDGSGVEALQELMNPTKVVERHHKDPQFIAAMKAKGWLPPPDRRPGRTSQATLTQRDEYDRRKRALNDQPPPEDDDSALREMIEGPIQ